MMKTIQLLLFMLFISLITYGWPGQKIVYPAELSKLHENVLSNILEDPAKINEAEKSLAELKENGSWADVIYDDKVDGPWRTREHLIRLLNIVKAYRTKGSKFYQDKTVPGKIHLALNYWLNNNFKSPYAWWYNEIGTPETLAPILMLMEDELSKKQIERGVIILNRSKIKYTGQNRVWVTGNLLMKSLLLKNTDSIRIASKIIHDELVVRLGEGIQPDWSFHQHGSQLQFGNYGLSFVGDMNKWIKLLGNTPFSFDERKMEILRNYLLEGMQWASWKGRFDIPSCGRKLEEDSPTKKAGTLLSIYKTMEKLDPAYAKEYRKASDYNNLEGHKHFWRSEYQVKRNDDYMFSVKMVSKRVKGAESSRYENIQGYHMGDGATYLCLKGDEYENVFPYWDWKKIPGATIKQDDKKLPVLLAEGYFTENEFVGGVSDGNNGIAVMDFKRDGLSARKSWFMFNDMILCLGAGISLSENVQVTTSVNQTFYREIPVIKTKEGIRLSGEKEKLTDPLWILHSKIGYFFPDIVGKDEQIVGSDKDGRPQVVAPAVHLETKMIEGSWHNYATYIPDEKVSSRIFNLWLNHGVSPKNQSYSYILLPNGSKERLEKMEKDAPFSFYNTDKLQEVITADKKLVGVVFYQPGKSNLFGGITASEACIVMLKKEKTGIRLSVSDPTQKLTVIQLAIRGEFQSSNSITRNGETVVNITLPKGGEAGKTETVILNRR